LCAAQQRSEELILSLLPASIAERLKTQCGTIADGIAECTVLFADLVGFSALSREVGPRALVGMLNRLFSDFDALCREHGLEKIKTIGDAYMAAAGVPDFVDDHPARAADTALAMLRVVERFNAEAGMALGVRIGMHCGPVIAGIIGTGKFAYDLWGETVNTASRMESHGASGRIQLTEAAALRLKRTHEVEERGVIEVKGGGPTKTFWLVARRTQRKEGIDASRAGIA
jgi:class 3 adenylate cyclase